MRRAIAACTVVAAATALLGCRNAPTLSSCQQLLSHIVDLELKAAGGAPKRADFIERKQGLMEAVRADFVRACVDTLSTERVACGLKARNQLERSACDQGD